MPCCSMIVPCRHRNLLPVRVPERVLVGVRVPVDRRRARGFTKI